MDGITWEQFLREIKIIHAISQELHDDWLLMHAVRDFVGAKMSNQTI